MIVEKIFRAYLDFVQEKYKHEHLKDKIHVHDLIRCKHKSQMEAIFPELASTASPIFLLGEALDEFIKALVLNKKEMLFADLETTSGEFTKDITFKESKITLIGKPDIVLKDIVIEIKYSRNIEDKPLDHHINQLKLYMFLTDKSKGILIYFTPQGLREYVFDEVISEEFVRELLATWASPRYEWECQYCNFRNICPHRIIPTEKREEEKKENNET